MGKIIYTIACYNRQWKQSASKGFSARIKEELKIFGAFGPELFSTKDSSTGPIGAAKGYIVTVMVSHTALDLLRDVYNGVLAVFAPEKGTFVDLPSPRLLSEALGENGSLCDGDSKSSQTLIKKGRTGPS